MPAPTRPPPFRVGFVTGVAPDKWARSWAQREVPPSLELVPLQEADGEPAVREGRVDMALVRLPVEREGLHLVPLYDEVPVVVVGREHPVAAYDQIGLDELVDEQFVLGPPPGLTPAMPQLAFPPMSIKDAVEVAASGSGVVVLPMSVARLFRRKDVVHCPVSGLDPTQVGLVWLVERDDDTTQAFVGVVRGRTPRSSRG